DRLSLHDLLDQGIPLAGPWRVSQPVNARRSKRADGKALAEPVTVHERLDGRLVGTVVALGPERMGLVERAIREDPVVHGTRGDEDESADLRRSRRLDEAESSCDIGLNEVDQVSLGAAESSAGMVQ